MHKIIEQLNQDNGSNYKMDVLREHKDNETLQKLLKMTYCKVSYTYGISMKNIKADFGASETGNFTLEYALDILENDFATRKVTGNSALGLLTSILEKLTVEDAEIVKGVINRDLRINMGRSNINKVFKNLIVKPPYMRCGIYTEKTQKKINFPAIVQLKADGMFQAINVDQRQVTFTARSGEVRELPHLEAKFRDFEDGVYIGELLVHGLENRSESNGVINSDDSKENVYIQLWDFVTHTEYANGKGKNTTTYNQRFQDLINNVVEDEHIKVIESHQVNTIQEALAHTSKWMNEGLEGAILKDYSNVFKDHTSPTQLKLKLEIDAEVRCTGFTAGAKGTKREATFGAISFENDEGTIKGSTSGFTDAQIEEFHNNREKYIGKVMTVQFNDVTKGRDNDYYALSHPRFIEFRDDKNITDTLERVLESKEMAMSLGDNQPMPGIPEIDLGTVDIFGGERGEN